MEVKDAIALAGSFPETELKPHFEKLSFRVRNKIFATLSETDGQMVVKLTPEQQPDWVARIPALQPVAGGWGRRGWSTIDLAQIRPEVLREVLTTAYCNVAPKSLSGRYT
ncbi:MAG: MmcQ/YjbR family DNA-binding protein [Saprospiraceae bacterium]|nr:MmcQ/YjbR family DNA-binding protein [Saprospiraceae bacterium]